MEKLLIKHKKEDILITSRIKIHEDISNEEISLVSNSIKYLPLLYKEVLFYRYILETSREKANNDLNINNSNEILLYIQRILSLSLDLEDSLISDESIKKALKEYCNKDYENFKKISIAGQYNYSNNYWDKLKNINIKKPKPKYSRILKRVAMFFLIFFISVISFLTINVQAREAFKNWWIQITPEYTGFSRNQENSGESEIDVNEINIELEFGYIPEGFKLEDEQIFEEMSIYLFKYNSKELDIEIFSKLYKGITYRDTEDAIVTEIEYNGKEAFIWEKDGYVTLLFYMDDNMVSIGGHISEEDVFTIAENLIIKE